MLELGLDALWAEAVEKLQNDLSTPSFETWVRAIHPQSLEDDVVVLAVPTEFTRHLILSRYANALRDILSNIAGRNLNFHILVNPEIAAAENSPPHPGPEPAAKLVEKPRPVMVESEFQTRLNPRYVFEVFVVGNSNRFAHAASQAVAEMPARAYNPLFIYGGVGLGKTHLMHAIGHQVLRGLPNARVLYVSAENFTNEMINAIRDDRMVQFRNRYRGIDVLLIDDIQFVAGKERTQEEFFHTFEALHGARKQIVISSDRPPKDIPTLEERLRSRFEWGLITDIQAPDLETRIAILAKKAQIENISVPSDVIHFIASRIDTNIRELEGALIRVMAYSSIIRQTLSPELAFEALKDVIPSSRPRPITIRMIQEEVAKQFELRSDDLKAKKRTRAVAYPRQIAMFLSREMTDASLPKIGEEFGGRDHTTVMHACLKITKEQNADTQLHQLLEQLKNRIRSR